MYFTTESSRSRQTYDAAVAACPGAECSDAMRRAHAEVGPFNLYDVYDNCPGAADLLRQAGQDMHWLLPRWRRAAVVPQTASRGATVPFNSV